MRFLKNLTRTIAGFTLFAGLLAWVVSAFGGIFAYYRPSWHIEGIQIVKDQVHFWYLIPAIALLIAILITLAIAATLWEGRTIR